ncbi:MAG: 23S rRNA (guanosine(2251)-2'-O)-methyltransferase RlmB [Minisyncoccia bacterium]
MKMKKETFYIYGKKPVEEQLMRNPKNVVRIFISDAVSGTSQEFTPLKQYAKEHNIPYNSISKHKLKEYVGDVNSQGVLALVRKYEFMTFDQWAEGVDMESLPGVMILDGVQDTHNYGAILRTAAAVGVSVVIVAKDRQAPVNGTVFKTSAGAVLTVPIVQVSNINQTIKKLQDMRFWVAAIDMDEDKKNTIWNQTYDTAMAFIVGAEGKGIPEKTREHVDFITAIPMENDIESLNVSVAAAVALYEWKRQIVKILK